MLATLLSLYQRFAARRMFSRWSPVYEEEVAENAYSAADEVAKVAIAALARENLKDALIVDAGIGTGLLAGQVYDTIPCRIIGLDFTEDMMAVCAAREITELLIKCDVGKDAWPIPPSSAQMVISSGLLEYLTPPMLQHFLEQSHKILQQNGILVFTYLPTEEAEKSTRLWRGHSGTYLTCAYNPSTMERLLKEKGFKIVQHSQPFKGCVFQDGSSYDYRLITARSLSCRVF